MDKEHAVLTLENSLNNFFEKISTIQKQYQKLLRNLQKQVTHETYKNFIVESMANNIANGIRNPLGGIANFVHLLAENVDTGESEKIARIYEGIHRIDKIVENLILFSRPLVPNFVHCDLENLLQISVKNIRCSISHPKDYDFLLKTSHKKIFGRVDPHLLQKAFHHILQNAVESMPEGGMIKISLQYRPEKDQVKIQFKDKGTGLIENDRTRPFEPFYTTKSYGMGLGLSISRLIVEKHGGKVWISPNKLTGITVTITLPGEGAYGKIES